MRCAQLLSYGLESHRRILPSWYVQFLDNELREGQTSAETTGSVRHPDLYAGPITRCTIHRREVFLPDNSGDIVIGGNSIDSLVESCVLGHPGSAIRTKDQPQGVVFRNNRFAGGANRYEVRPPGAALILPVR